LNADGSLDTTFDPAAGADDTVYAVARQSDGKIVIGGTFKNVQTLSRRSVTRLNANGIIDLTFNPGALPTNYARTGKAAQLHELPDSREAQTYPMKYLRFEDKPGRR